MHASLKKGNIWLKGNRQIKTAFIGASAGMNDVQYQESPKKGKMLVPCCNYLRISLINRICEKMSLRVRIYFLSVAFFKRRTSTTSDVYGDPFRIGTTGAPGKKLLYQKAILTLTKRNCFLKWYWRINHVLKCLYVAAAVYPFIAVNTDTDV